MKALQPRTGFRVLLALALAGVAACAPRQQPGTPQPATPSTPPAGAPLDVPLTARTQPTPFAFDIEQIDLKFGDRSVMQQQFREGRLRATVNLGKVSDANVRGGALRITQDATTNIWLGKGGTFGHRLHHHDVFITLLTFPIDATGRSTFLAREAFPLEFTIRVRNPRFTGFEKVKVGLLDMEAFKSVAAIAVGRLPTPFPPVGPIVGGGGTKTINILDLVSNPAIVLNRVEEPDIMGEIVLDHAPLTEGARTDTLEMTLRVGPQGEISGFSRIGAAGQTREVKLATQSREPFFERRSRLPGDMRLAATLYVETLPMPTVFKVEPQQFAMKELAASQNLSVRIEGIGFGPDTRVEMVPEGSREAPIPAASLKLERKHGTPDGAVLLAEFGMRDRAARAASYSLRITTGGQRAVMGKALRVF